MNVFEDLVEELKEENLLEETVIETNREQEEKNSGESSSEAEILLIDEAVEPEMLQDEENEFPEDIEPLELSSEDEPSETEMSAENSASDEETEAGSDSEKEEYAESVEIESQPQQAKGVEFYRQRAMKEVSSLQMIEHVLSGVEREQMKVVPKPYDDLEAKKILHHFLQVSKDLNSPEHAQAEFALMQETESWYSALSHRDKNVSVTHLRRYCETTRPLLSSQALISVARFYRNSPFSEQVRSKFDLVITRLFAKDIGGEKRQMVFEREDMIKHLTMLYGEWSSIPLYAANEDDSDILLIVLKFEDFMAEAENADNFDELIKNDFFNRLRMFKESTNENFFAPLVTSTAIECNVRVGNRYVDLIQQEKENTEREKLEDKYGFLHDQAISEAASKTLQLVELLKEKALEIEPEYAEDDEAESVEPQPQSASNEKTGKVEKKKKSSRFAVNKWLLAATVLVVLFNIGLYFYSRNINDAPDAATQNVQRVNLDNSALKEFIKEGRIANETFFGVVQPSWSTLDQEKKEDILKKIYSTAGEKAFNKVELLNKDGKIVGFADSQNVQAY
jgi:hypothetical protein